ncbi:MAG: class II aldolase/adducin family protein [Gammaproteobacteria bacterium]
MQEQEGVIQFDLHWRQTNVIRADLAALNAWRSILCKLDLIGQDLQRYNGVGFGNVSQRYGTEDQFIISGTQTGHIAHTDESHYALVTDFDPDTNRVVAEGPLRPSSESMTHGVIYRLDDSVNCIVHVHSPDIWNVASKLVLPMTRAEVAYGTPEMASEVSRLFRETDVRERGIFGMAGHRDGVVAFGSSPEIAGVALIKILARSAG